MLFNDTSHYADRPAHARATCRSGGTNADGQDESPRGGRRHPARRPRRLRRLIIITALEANLSASRAMARLYGFAPGELVGHSMDVLLPDSHRGELDTMLAAARSGVGIDRLETERQTKDGLVVEVALTVSPVRDDTGRVIGMMSLARESHRAPRPRACAAGQRRALARRRAIRGRRHRRHRFARHHRDVQPGRGAHVRLPRRRGHRQERVAADAVARSRASTTAISRAISQTGVRGSSASAAR